MPNMFMLTPSVLDLLLIIEFVIYDRSFNRIFVVCLRTSVGMRRALSDLQGVASPKSHILLRPTTHYFYRFRIITAPYFDIVECKTPLGVLRVTKNVICLGFFAFGFLLLICLISENK